MYILNTICVYLTGYLLFRYYYLHTYVFYRVFAFRSDFLPLECPHSQSTHFCLALTDAPSHSIAHRLPSIPSPQSTSSLFRLNLITLCSVAASAVLAEIETGTGTATETGSVNVIR